MSERAQPKFRVSKRMDNGEFLTLAIWPGKSNPEDEVINVQVRKLEGEWKTAAKLAVYRTKSGNYSELPETAKAQTAKGRMQNASY